MAEERIKVINTRGNGLTINLTRLNGKEVPIAPKGFAFLTIDELAYVRNTSKAFERGTLVLEDGEMEKLEGKVDIPESPNALTDKDIVAILKLPVGQLGNKLEEITVIQVIEDILAKAKEADKSVKFIEAIEARKEQLLKIEAGITE